LLLWFGFGGAVRCCSLSGLEVEERAGHVEIIAEAKGPKSSCCFNVSCTIPWNGSQLVVRR
jgi:hypothetical protein